MKHSRKCRKIHTFTKSRKRRICNGGGRRFPSITIPSIDHREELDLLLNTLCFDNIANLSNSFERKTNTNDLLPITHVLFNMKTPQSTLYGLFFYHGNQEKNDPYRQNLKRILLVDIDNRIQSLQRLKKRKTERENQITFLQNWIPILEDDNNLYWKQDHFYILLNLVFTVHKVNKSEVIVNIEIDILNGPYIKKGMGYAMVCIFLDILKKIGCYTRFS